MRPDTRSASGSTATADSAISMVCPSGSALATAAAPIAPPAPARLSTTTDCPRILVRPSARGRAAKSRLARPARTARRSSRSAMATPSVPRRRTPLTRDRARDPLRRVGMCGYPSECPLRVELKLVPDTQDPYQQSEIRKSRLPFEAAIKAWVNSETSLLALGGHVSVIAACLHLGEAV